MEPSPKRTPPPSPDPITQLIGARLPALRKAAGGMGQEDLGRRMSALGCKGWGRTTVQKLENDRRGSISVQELLALALVLGFPPVLLLADPRAGRTLTVARGVTMSTDMALAWLTGETPIDGQRAGEDMPEVAPTQAEVAEFMTRWHHVQQARRQLFELRRVRHRLVVGSGGIEQRSDLVGEPAELDETSRRLQDAYEQAEADLAEYLPGHRGDG